MWLKITQKYVSGTFWYSPSKQVSKFLLHSANMAH